MGVQDKLADILRTDRMIYDEILSRTGAGTETGAYVAQELPKIYEKMAEIEKEVKEMKKLAERDKQES
jgi:hypothetical protein